MPKTNAEICRAYYQRKKLTRNKIKKIPLSSTERVRNFRARQRALRECALNIHNFGSSTNELLTRNDSFEPDPSMYSTHNHEKPVDKSSDTVFFEPEIEIKEEISYKPSSVCKEKEIIKEEYEGADVERSSVCNFKENCETIPEEESKPQDGLNILSPGAIKVKEEPEVARIPFVSCGYSSPSDVHVEEKAVVEADFSIL